MFCRDTYNQNVHELIKTINLFIYAAYTNILGHVHIRYTYATTCVWFVSSFHVSIRIL